MELSMVFIVVQTYFNLKSNCPINRYTHILFVGQEEKLELKYFPPFKQSENSFSDLDKNTR